MSGTSRVERLGSEPVGKLLLEMSSQTTFSLLVYTIYIITDTYFLSVGINALAAAGASVVSPVLIGLGAVATTVGAGGASVVSRALGEHECLFLLLQKEPLIRHQAVVFQTRLAYYH